FQFGYFNQKAFKTQADFLAVLKPFLKKLPVGYQFALEIRNKNWINAEFADALAERSIALALIDQSWVPRPWELKEKFDLVTTDFAYVRWLGDRHGIEKITRVWDRTVVDRTEGLSNWVEIFKTMVANKRILKVFAFSNNHYGGSGPA